MIKKTIIQKVGSAEHGCSRPDLVMYAKMIIVDPIAKAIQKLTHILYLRALANVGSIISSEYSVVPPASYYLFKYF